jgi:hypothetical protein
LVYAAQVEDLTQELQEKEHKLLYIESRYNQLSVSHEQSQDSIKRMEILLNDRTEEVRKSLENE